MSDPCQHYREQLAAAQANLQAIVKHGPPNKPGGAELWGHEVAQASQQLTNGDAGVSFILATEGSVTSSDGAHTFTGSRLDPTTGAVTLVGKSNIDGDSAYIGGKDAIIAIKGTLSSVPVWSQSGGVGQAPTQEAARQ
jgi:hypothetical protein